jgi:hypothetical protein
VRAVHLGLISSLLGCPAPAPVSDAGRREPPTRAAEAVPSSGAEPSAEPVEPVSEGVATPARLPASTRTFAIALTAAGPDIVLGAQDETLWARRPTDDGFEELWVSKGPGSVQEVIVGELGGERSLFVGRGRARGNMIPFVRVDRVDLESGTAKPLIREESERADIAQLVTAEIDGSGPSLVVGFFETKHSVGLRYLRGDGSVKRGPSQLMATSRVFVDIDDDGTPDEVIGRVYGDDQGSPGDLTVRMGERTHEIPTQGGVRAIAAARLEGDEKTAIYFADGWSANYGTDARAKLARARFSGDGFEVERLAESPGEYTLFSIFVVPVGDRDRLFVQGSRYLSVLEPDRAGGVALRRLLSFDKGAGQGAIGRGVDGRLWWYWPGEAATSATPIDLDVSKPVPVAG